MTNEELAAKVDALTERVEWLVRVVDAVARGLSAPPRRRWTTVADAVPVAPAPEPVEPTWVMLPPTESAEDAERMAAAVRKLLGDAFDGGAKGGA